MLLPNHACEFMSSYMIRIVFKYLCMVYDISFEFVFLCFVFNYY